VLVLSSVLVLGINTLTHWSKLFQADSMTYMVLGCHINLGLFTLAYSSCVLTLDALLWCRWECLILAWTSLLAFFFSTSCLHNINKLCAFVHTCPENNHGCHMNERILLTSIVMCRSEVGITLERMIRTLELYQSREARGTLNLHLQAFRGRWIGTKDAPGKNPRFLEHD
jgi:hypothetical protein